MGVKTSPSLIRLGVNSFWNSNVAPTKSLYNIFFLLNFLKQIKFFFFYIYIYFPKNSSYKNFFFKKTKKIVIKTQCNFKFYWAKTLKKINFSSIFFYSSGAVYSYITLKSFIFRKSPVLSKKK